MGLSAFLTSAGPAQRLLSAGKIIENELWLRLLPELQLATNYKTLHNVPVSSISEVQAQTDTFLRNKPWQFSKAKDFVGGSRDIGSHTQQLEGRVLGEHTGLCSKTEKA